MNHDSELRDILNTNFQWNKARITCFAKMLLSLLSTRTVNLNKIACSMSSNTEQTSRYRRIQRFFATFTIDFDMIAGFIFKLFFTSGGKWYLTMDRTNWQWGKSDINILTLAVVFKGIAIPLYWELLDKRGNSDTNERIAIVQKFIDKFGKDCIAGLLGDREFIGEKWFEWLINERIIFYMRIKKNLITTDSRGRTVHVNALFRGLKPTEVRALYGDRKITGQTVYIEAMKLPDGELLIIASNDMPGNLITKYAFRWEIETLFSCLKGRGFNFEDTHIIDRDRIKKLIVLLAVAFCWAHKTGEWRHEQRAIRIKKHGRPEVSLFRYGLDYLVDALANPSYKYDSFAACMRKVFSMQPDLQTAGCVV
jgi:hypothetical protein